MSDFEAPPREYTRPPMTRGVDPQRMNWLWQLILQATDLDAEEVRAVVAMKKQRAEAIDAAADAAAAVIAVEDDAADNEPKE